MSLFKYSPRLRAIANRLRVIAGFGSRQTVLPGRFDKTNSIEATQGSIAPKEGKFSRASDFWSCSGSYIGYRASDGLFDSSGRQIGYFAEGNEIYGCHGRYLGEVRGLDRLETNPRKKAWTRTASAPKALGRSAAHRDQRPVEMRSGYEDFTVAR